MKRLALLVAFGLSLRCPLRDSSRDRPIPGALLTPARQGSAMQPYYSTPDGMIRIFHARWEDVLAAGIFKPKDIALVHADPPYGIDYNANKGRRDRPGKSNVGKAGQVFGKDWNRVVGDEQPFDPGQLLALDKPSILWGANNYAERLPSNPGWIVWEKKRDGTVGADMNVSDAELAWCNFGTMVRVYHSLWCGFRRDTEVGDHYHPTQKPESLSAFVFDHAEKRKKLKRGDTILVPYMGSGPDLRPAQAMGLKVIACEVDESYCATAVNARLRAVASPLDDSKLGPLFEART